MSIEADRDQLFGRTVQDPTTFQLLGASAASMGLNHLAARMEVEAGRASESALDALAKHDAVVEKVSDDLLSTLPKAIARLNEGSSIQQLTHGYLRLSPAVRDGLGIFADVTHMLPTERPVVKSRDLRFTAKGSNYPAPYRKDPDDQRYYPRIDYATIGHEIDRDSALGKIFYTPATAADRSGRARDSVFWPQLTQRFRTGLGLEVVVNGFSSTTRSSRNLKKAGLAGCDFAGISIARPQESKKK